ncbi:MAG TPA: HPr family phosphocarrier protein [Phycisphaerales bacterium]|nr:HPr family phosphocarrier protein [Phycisphaerales bacterium]
MTKTCSAKVEIANRLGLHARPAMLFVETASGFQSKITVRRCDQPEEHIDGKSIMQMMMLAATRGTAIEIIVEGEEQEVQKAIKALVALVERKFDED